MGTFHLHPLYGRHDSDRPLSLKLRFLRFPNPPPFLRPCSNPRFREALVGKMLISKPFIVVKISDSNRVLLDIIALCLPWARG